MDRINTLVKLFLLYLFVSTPFVLIGTIIDVQAGWSYGLIGGGVILLTLVLMSEKWILASHHLMKFHPRGLKRTIERSEERIGVAGILQVELYSDPSPKALVCKSIGSKGKILLSQGLLSALNENELRNILVHCQKQTIGFEPVLSSMCAVVAQFFLRLSSDSWVHVFYLQAESQAQWQKRNLSPASILSFLVFYPCVRWVLWLGRRNEFRGDHEIAHLTQRKLGRGWNQGYRPGLIHLYLSDPVIDLGGLAGPIK